MRRQFCIFNCPCTLQNLATPVLKPSKSFYTLICNVYSWKYTIRRYKIFDNLSEIFLSMSISVTITRRGLTMMLCERSVSEWWLERNVRSSKYKSEKRGKELHDASGYSG
ncbi:hypothetical protein SDJN03_03929, partial [Cucurbita argyrosperma subsp. sororia]